MKTLSFWPAVALALAISVLGWVLHSVIGGFVDIGVSLRVVVLVAAMLQVLALLATHPQRSGRVVAAGAGLALSGLLVLVDPALPVWLVAQTGFIWLLRSLQRYDSLLTASADALLSGFALSAAIATAMHTRSLFLSLWCYFLVQALAAFLPRRLPAAAPPTAACVNDFEASFRTAEAALRRLSLRS
jgi:hypothetical protein